MFILLLVSSFNMLNLYIKQLIVLFRSLCLQPVPWDPLATHPLYLTNPAMAAGVSRKTAVKPGERTHDACL